MTARRLSDAATAELAAELRRRERAAEAGPRLGTGLEWTLEDAYAVQQHYAATRVEGGARIVGRKVGATNPVIQRLFNVNEPDYGVLFDDMLLDDGAVLETAELIQPRVEPEIAFLLDRDLPGPNVTAATVLLSTAALVPCFEIIDSRITAWDITINETVADNGSSARCVLGAALVAPHSVDLRLTGVVLERNGRVADTGAGAAALGHPAVAVAWLANRLHRYSDRLRAGDVVLPGALTTAVPVEAGDYFEAHFAGMGRVSCRFA